MEIGYKSNKLEKSLTDAKTMLATYGNRAKKVNQRMMELKAAANLEVMKTIPAANCHPLTADRAGEIAVDISANWRITFVPDQDPLPSKEDGSLDWNLVTKVKIIEVTDYH